MTRERNLLAEIIMVQHYGLSFVDGVLIVPGSVSGVVLEDVARLDTDCRVRVLVHRSAKPGPLWQTTVLHGCIPGDITNIRHDTAQEAVTFARGNLGLYFVHIVTRDALS